MPGLLEFVDFYTSLSFFAANPHWKWRNLCSGTFGWLCLAWLGWHVQPGAEGFDLCGIKSLEFPSFQHFWINQPPVVIIKDKRGDFFPLMSWEIWFLIWIVQQQMRSEWRRNSLSHKSANLSPRAVRIGVYPAGAGRKIQNFHVPTPREASSPCYGSAEWRKSTLPHQRPDRTWVKKGYFAKYQWKKGGFLTGKVMKVQQERDVIPMGWRVAKGHSWGHLRDKWPKICFLWGAKGAPSPHSAGKNPGIMEWFGLEGP